MGAAEKVGVLIQCENCLKAHYHILLVRNGVAMIRANRRCRDCGWNILRPIPQRRRKS